MKYIRTKNGISKLDAQDDRLTNQINVCDCGWGYRGETPIRVADTIEELCDCFVNVSNVAKNIRITGKYHLVEPSLKLIKGMSGEQFGAIWTDKGLIYIAKMNEKGDLLLL